MRASLYLKLFLAAALTTSLAGTTGCRSTYYAMWEKMGKHKRDLLKDEVEEARDDQQKASDQFKDALTRLKEFYGYSGGDLETAHRKLNSDYEKCASRAEDVRKRISKVEQIAEDLFTEWETEIESYSNSKLKANSKERLNDTRVKFGSLRTAMNRAAHSMDPVLVQFRDQVLYLKHNLNAQAIGSLRGEVVDIEKEINQLIADMNKSILEANAFIQSL